MIFNIIFGFFGLLVGSFLNVLIFRFPEMKGLISGRSYCPKCKKNIAAYDLIPVIGYIILRGKCRNCQKKISLQYPIVELATGVLFFLLAITIGINYQLIIYLLIACVSLLIFVYDAKYLEIPEVFSWLLLIFVIISSFLNPHFLVQDFLLGGLIGGGILGIMVGISNEKMMGSGDIKIGLAFGFLLGIYRSILFLFLSFIIGAIAGLVLMASRKKKMKSEIAFAPFLILAAIISIVWGNQIVNLYLKFAMI
ncbi:MAG: prepilin peptidase [Candidatus Berkelbacteria bacterium]|nr:prepilin peptidase [Candidatus Berkelbacteria bacterium]